MLDVGAGTLGLPNGSNNAVNGQKVELCHIGRVSYGDKYTSSVSLKRYPDSVCVFCHTKSAIQNSVSDPALTDMTMYIFFALLAVVCHKTFAHTVITYPGWR